MIKGDRQQATFSIGDEDATCVAQRLGDGLRSAIKRRTGSSCKVVYQRSEGASFERASVRALLTLGAPQPLNLLARLLQFALTLFQFRARPVVGQQRRRLQTPLLI